MPRRSRDMRESRIYHVLNRAAGRRTIFEKDADYTAFQRALQQAGEREPVRLLAYCLMPNHWHLIVWAEAIQELSEFMRWLTTTHAIRWHVAHDTTGTGPVYQGRFKSVPIQDDDRFYQACRYLERNPLRAGLVTRAEFWRWSSLWQWCQERGDVTLHAWPLPRHRQWVDYVNATVNERELAAMRNAIQRGREY